MGEKIIAVTLTDAHLRQAATNLARAIISVADRVASADTTEADRLKTLALGPDSPIVSESRSVLARFKLDT